MNNICCTACDYVFNFEVDLSAFENFICPKCKTIHSITNGSLLSLNRKSPNISKDIYGLSVGGKMVVNGKKCVIISIYQKKSPSLGYNWVEIGLKQVHTSTIFYYSIDADYIVYKMDVLTLPSAFDLGKASGIGIRKFNKSFFKEEGYLSVFTAGEGFSAVDLTQKSLYYSFFPEKNDETDYSETISIEHTGDKLQGFHGKEITLSKLLYQCEEKADIYREQFKNFNKKFYTLFFGLVGLLLFTFIGLYARGVVGKSEELFVTERLVLKNRLLEQNRLEYNYDLKIDKAKNGVIHVDGSISSCIVNQIHSFKIINKNTQRIIYDKAFSLEDNGNDRATALAIKLTGITPGTYTFVIEIDRSSIIDLNSEYVDGNYDLDIDLRVQTGVKINYWPIIIAIGLLILIFSTMYKDKSAKFSLKPHTYWSIINLNNSLYFVMVIVLFIGYISVESYFNIGKKENYMLMEDASYHGSRYHFIYYRPDTGHK